MLLLAALNMSDEFDRIAFSALSPEIRDHFHLSDSDILLVNVVPGVIILLTAGLMGWLSDRYDRVKLSLIAAIAWGLASIGTGWAPSLLFLLFVRIFSGLGRTANEIIHPSLIADLYEERVHPRAYIVHRLGNPLAQVSGIAAGWIGGRYGWTWAFYILAIPTAVLALGLSQLRDPGRRVRPTDNAEKISLLKGARQLARIPSFPRLWVAAGFLGAASFGIFGLASLYFEKEFGLGARGRGFVQFLIGAGWFGGVLLGGRFASSATASGRYKRLVVICATSFLAIAISGTLLSVVPSVFLAYVATVILAVGNGVWQSPFFSTVAKVAPPSLSGQAFGSAATTYALGSFLILPVAFIADHSKRGAFLVIALFGALSGLAAWSVTYTIEQDIGR